MREGSRVLSRPSTVFITDGLVVRGLAFEMNETRVLLPGCRPICIYDIEYILGDILDN